MLNARPFGNAGADARLVGGGQLPHGRPDLPAGQPAAATSRCGPEHIKPRLLGHWGTSPGLNLVYAHLNSLIRETGQEVLFVAGPGPRRAGGRRQRLSRGHLLGRLPGGLARRGGPAAAGAPVLDPGRDPEPRQRPDPGLDPRGRRARLLARPRLRRRVRQPRPARRLRDRRRRGRDGTAGGLVEGHALSQPRPRRRGAADPAPERAQDLGPDGARPGDATRRSPACCAGHGYEPAFVEGHEVQAVHMHFDAGPERRLRAAST